MVRKIWKTALLAVKAFFGIGKQDTLASGSGKVAVTVGQRVAYLLVDYWVAILCAAMVSTLKFWGWSQLSIMFATWAFAFVAAVGVLVASEKSGCDFTLGESLRRAADVIHASHKATGYLSFAGITLKALLWDGPEQIVVFFKNEIGDGLALRILVLVPLTLIPGIFWSWVYGLGYDSATALIKGMF